MKIAFLRKGIKEGGAKRYIENVSKILSDLGHSVYLYSDKISRSKYYISKRVPLPKIFSPLSHLLFAMALKPLVFEKFDVIQSLSPTFYQDLYRITDGLICVHRSIKKINPITSQKFKLISFIERVSLFSSKAVICMSNLEKDLLISNFPELSKNSHVIYNGVDRARFNPSVKRFKKEVRKRLGIGERDFLFLFCGYDFARKGLLQTILAFSRLKRKDIYLLVLGNTNAYRYKRLAKSVGVEEHVIFIPPKDDIEKFYGASDVLVLPSLYDPFGNSYLEAMACGTPVITTSMAGAKEIVSHKSSGFILDDPTDIRKLEFAMNFMLDGDRFLYMGERAYLETLCMSWEESVKKLLEIYKRVKFLR